MGNMVLSLLSAALVFCGTFAAVAQTTPPMPHQDRIASQNAGILSEQELESHLKQQGYTAIGMVKLVGNIYEARAFNKDGKSVAIEVDAKSGKVLSEGPSPRT